MSAIEPAAIKAHIDFLASDALEGRETGTRGYDIAARYVASQFALAGLEPRTQEVRLRTALLDNASFSVDGRPFVHRKDVIVAPSFLGESVDVEGEVVFAGFGILAPKLGHDDYANLDVKGKVVLVLSGAPPRFPTTERAFYSDTDRKLRLAADRGATGLLMLRTRVDEARTSFERFTQQPPSTSMAASEESVIQLRGRALVNADVAEVLFAGAPTTVARVLDDAEKGVAHSFPLRTRVAMHTQSKIGEARSVNVYTVLRGSSKPDEHEGTTKGLRRLGPRAPDPADRPSLRDTSWYLARRCRGGWACKRGPGPWPRPPEASGRSLVLAD